MKKEILEATIKEGTVSHASRLLEKTYLRLYEGIDLRFPPDLNIPQLNRENQIVFVLNHQSHADYVLFNYILHKTYGLLPYTLGGINLNIFPLSRLFRRLGCIFIKRSFRDDPAYKLALENYLHRPLVEGIHPLEFFYEGTRSRSGKLLPPRIGAFKLLLSAQNKLPRKKPLVFLPVAVAHEIIPESRALAREAAGALKSAEGPFQLLKLFGLWGKKFGTTHFVGGPVLPVGEREKGGLDLGKEGLRLARLCFQKIQEILPFTATSLLATVLIERPEGDPLEEALHLWYHLREKHLPLAPSLDIQDPLPSLIHGLELLKCNGMTLPERRLSLTYLKNMVAHHLV